VEEGRRPDDPARWGLGDALVGYLVAFTLVAVAGSVWLGVTGDDDESLGLLVTILLAQWVGLLGAVLLASRRKGAGRLADDFGLRVEPRDVGVGVAAGLLSQFVLVPLLYLPFRFLDDDFDVSEEAEELTDLAHGWSVVVLVVFLVVGAPLVEELFFRGLLLRSLARRFGAGWGVAGSAVAFGVVHFQPLQLLGLVAFGVVLAVLAQRSGRLGPGLVAHATFNAATVVLLRVL
jgi:membrane protease YdiL (CAAX protease family)